MVALGVIALVIAVVALVGSLTGTLARLRAPRVPVVDCADLARTGGRATVVGVVEPPSEREGPLYAPVSGRACAWFTSTVVEYWVEHDRDRVRDFDGDGPLHHREMRTARRGRSRAENRTSRRPFVVRDDTGTVLVDPVDLRADRLPVSVRDSVGDTVGGVAAVGARDGAVAVDFGSGVRRTRRVARYDRTETVLMPGERVFVTGQVVRRRDGTVVLGGRGATVSRGASAGARGGRLRARAGLTVGALAGLIGVAALVAGAARH